MKVGDEFTVAETAGAGNQGIYSSNVECKVGTTTLQPTARQVHDAE